ETRWYAGASSFRSVGGGEGLVEVGDEVRRVLDADGQAHDVRRGAGGLELVAGQLAVRGGRRVDHQRTGVAQVGHVREQLERVDELHAGVVAAFQRDGEQRTATLRADPLLALPVR